MESHPQRKTKKGKQEKKKERKKEKRSEDEYCIRERTQSLAGISRCIKTPKQGLPWPSSGKDSKLPLQGAWVRSLVGELGSCKPQGQKNKIRRPQNNPQGISRKSALPTPFLPCSQQWVWTPGEKNASNSLFKCPWRSLKYRLGKQKQNPKP